MKSFLTHIQNVYIIIDFPLSVQYLERILPLNQAFFLRKKVTTAALSALSETAWVVPWHHNAILGLVV